ncbi:helix-turn-helix domain-containing protein [Streptomyces erythrochromogenes]|uniref:helix-turn-helix domain-containing protein n=1 Tax=Streptomyces erythrochromogenes TaxID=285574 RepID=UPI0036B755B0
MPTALEASPGERLRTLRDLLGLTGADLQRLTKISQSWISQVETGAREPAEDRLRVIAEATDTPMSFFYARPSSVPLDSLRFRKMATASRIVTRRISAFYGEGFRVTEEITGRARYPTPPLPFASEPELGNGDIEELASQTRVALRLAADKPIPHLTRALERAGIAVAPIVLPDPTGDSVSPTNKHFGVSYWAGIGETALIAYFPGPQGDRDRFTLAHELGHLVLHTFRPHAADPEGEANRFAGAFLVPYERAREEMTDRLTLEGFARRKQAWGVSIQALILRGAAVGNIGESRKRSLYVQLTQRGWRKVEPVSVGQEDPLLLWSLLQRQYGDRPYLPASDELAIQPTVLRSIAPQPANKRPTVEASMPRPDGKVLDFAARAGQHPAALRRAAQ